MNLLDSAFRILAGASVLTIAVLGSAYFVLDQIVPPMQDVAYLHGADDMANAWIGACLSHEGLSLQVGETTYIFCSANKAF